MPKHVWVVPSSYSTSASHAPTSLITHEYCHFSTEFDWIKRDWQARWQPVPWKSTFDCPAPLASQTYLPVFILLSLSVCLSLSRSPYSLFNRHHITQVYRGFLPAALPANKANLCLVRGGEAWQVRGAKMGILNGALYSLLVDSHLSGSRLKLTP